MPDGGPQVGDRAGRGRAQQRFQLCEQLLDRIEVRTVGGKVEQARAGCLDSFPDARDLVGAEVVHDDRVAALQGGDERAGDVGQEPRPLVAPSARSTAQGPLVRSAAVTVVVL